MKKTTFLLLYLNAILNCYSQDNSLKVHLVDHNLNPIPYATIISTESREGTYSNIDGIFTIKKRDTLLIRHVSYYSLKVSPYSYGDTITMTGRTDYLAPVVIYPAFLSKNKKLKYSKKYSLNINSPSLETGTIIPSTDTNIKNIIIPFRTKQQSSLVRLKLYSVLNGKPNDLLYSELHELSSSDRNHYLSFATDLSLYTERNDSVFASVELIETSANTNSDPYKSPALVLYFTMDIKTTNTFSIRNHNAFRIWGSEAKWRDLETVIPNLIYFLEE